MQIWSQYCRIFAKKTSKSHVKHGSVMGKRWRFKPEDLNWIMQWHFLVTPRQPSQEDSVDNLSKLRAISILPPALPGTRFVVSPHRSLSLSLPAPTYNIFVAELSELGQLLSHQQFGHPYDGQDGVSHILRNVRATIEVFLEITNVLLEFENFILKHLK